MAEKQRAKRTMRIGIDPATVDQQAATTSRSPARGEAHTWHTQHQQRDTPFYELLESVYDAVLITTRTGKIIECNERAC
ncbi:MAG TPA: hypothetical protein PLM82_12435, partial [Candidatus Latescibacteria bacterium]|nr:hypothetical protein [Candidatus Latescibacterota bacterium]